VSYEEEEDTCARQLARDRYIKMFVVCATFYTLSQKSQEFVRAFFHLSHTHTDALCRTLSPSRSLSHSLSPALSPPSPSLPLCAY